MEHIHLKEELLYDGSQIKPMWALKEYNIKGSSIVTWIGPMNIKKDEVIDFEDLELDIKSDEMLHFIVEHFDIQPADLRLGYHRQRILVMILKETLMELGIETRRSGDDLYHQEGKLTVSIATCSQNSTKIHLGINLTTQGTPDDVKTAGLLGSSNNIKIDEKIKRDQIPELASEIAKRYDDELSSIEADLAKTRVF